jgi:dihydroorotase
VGPGAILGGRSRRRSFGLAEGAPANLVVFDRSDSWVVSPEALASKGARSPFISRQLPGRVLLTIADGRLAYEGD